MRICWFNDNRLGLVEGDQVKDVSAALRVLPTPTYPAPHGDLLIANLDAIRAEIAAVAPGAKAQSIKGVKFLSPVANPSKIIGVPVNYLKHIQEAEGQRDVFSQKLSGGIREQGLFIKANSALVGPSAGVTINWPDRRNDHEMELGIIIGKTCKNIPESESMSVIAGYALALDMVVRGTEDRSFRKSADSYAVLGPWLTTADEVPNPSNLSFSLKINGEVRQSSNTEFLILNIVQQIAWASSAYTLYPGDIIMSGTCEGVSQINPGDVMQCHIDGVGDMDVPVH